MSVKEAIARIKINHLLEEAGWRFFDNDNGQANICLEPKVKVTSATLDNLGSNFEKTSNGFIDFLLRDLKAVPLKYRQLIPEYVKDYVPLNQFIA